ncbi:S1 family peptidase [Nocardioides albus]|uniref:Streptogrisin B n=1 Tax=Nocardioides albus TaxID=1841 RepID=A0A7W5FAQ2_9ACTN|nr:S1 family peptidase [Nocardioides albus]MBB3091538.1 streptogrisin B [Nocardioides albus]GGU41065.1 serine protease [Nocardioides albus]
MRFTRSRNRLLAAAVGLGLAATAAASPAVAAPPEEKLSAKTLAAVHSAVDSAVNRSALSGIAWYTDEDTGKVVITADSTVPAAALSRLTRTAGVDTDAITVKRTKGEFKPLVSAGDAIYGGGFRCSLGFNVRSGGSYYLLTAGHCAEEVGTWYTNSRETTRIGPTAKSSFPGNDYALVRYDNTTLSHPGGYTIGDARVGQRVTREGSSTGVRSGRVEALNVSVRYRGSGTVRGMIQADVCAESGDSGGPLYAGSTALGITSGGTGDCSSGGTTFFQPVREAVKAYDVSLY